MKARWWEALSRRMAAALVTLVAGGPLYCARPPKPVASAHVSPKQPAVTAAESRQFSVPNSACLPGSSCSDEALLARQMAALVNAERLDPANQPETGGHAASLRWDARLAQAARAHSQIMASRHVLSHIDPNGDSPVERIYRVGVQWVAMGENVAQNLSVAAAEAALMNEPRFQRNHRGNILSRKYNSIGVGVVAGTDGRLYITQDFAEEP